jgi:hypothetical protein
MNEDDKQLSTVVERFIVPTVFDRRNTESARLSPAQSTKICNRLSMLCFPREQNV